ncbi:ABC transporter ATP-binding protein [Magnetovibrio sp. PR-2]|uniref:ABC transporter ATP-binding protein n=1 Tax=Magnetovibrio sp. PR-2 TaxID=3120356 RepID=UPI002FCE5305
MSQSHTPVVNISDLRFRWPGHDTDVLDIADLSLSPRERLFIKGNSGSGKTTLLNCIAGVIAPQSGDVSVMGEPINRMSSWKRDAFRAQHIGVVFQIFNLIPYLSLIDNVTLPCKFSPARKAKALSRSNTLESEAARLLDHLALDVKALTAQPVSRLSVGQQQRVAVARALMGGPELIIADEPTSALDAEARHAFLELLFRELEDTGANLLFVSHDASLEANFTRSVHLEEINGAGVLT